MLCLFVNYNMVFRDGKTSLVSLSQKIFGLLDIIYYLMIVCMYSDFYSNLKLHSD
jgi:hypothetical protein